MINIAVIGAVLSIACVSAAASPTDYQTYFGARADSNRVILMQFEKAADRCETEASRPGRGSPVRDSYAFAVASRGCLARNNFVDRGAYAYPRIVLGLDHFLDR